MIIATTHWVLLTIALILTIIDYTSAFLADIRCTALFESTRSTSCGTSRHKMLLFTSKTNEQIKVDDGNNLFDPISKGDDGDLTIEEISYRFTDVLDHFGSQKSINNNMTVDDVRLSMMRTRLPDLHLNLSIIAPSNIKGAGQGLFARRDVAAKELITFYPGDALLKWDKGVGNFKGNIGVMFGDHIPVGAVHRDARRVSTDEARSYEINIGMNISLVADPLLIDDAAYSGHMINDGSALFSTNNASRTLYSRQTFDRHNAAFFDVEGCHLAVIATKMIYEGDEILVSYGEDYWLSRSKQLKRKSKKPKRGGGGGFG